MGEQGVIRSLLFEMRFWVRYLLPTKYVAVFYPSPASVVERMMALTDCGPKDCLFDLGCGDGRVLVAAAQRGARAVGYELDSELVSRAHAAIHDAKVSHLCKVIKEDASSADVSDASIIALFLSDRGNATLMKAVAPTLRPGTLVVSNFFKIAGWDEHMLRICTADPQTGPLYLYRSPAKSQ